MANRWKTFWQRLRGCYELIWKVELSVAVTWKTPTESPLMLTGHMFGRIPVATKVWTGVDRHAGGAIRMSYVHAKKKKTLLRIVSVLN